jgi:hypothetical protein
MSASTTGTKPRVEVDLSRYSAEERRIIDFMQATQPREVWTKAMIDHGLDQARSLGEL